MSEFVPSSLKRYMRDFSNKFKLSGLLVTYKRYKRYNRPCNRLAECESIT